MSDQPEQNLEPQAAAPTQQTLDGAWFRRERERVAIGRRSLAARLGTTESRLNTLEWRRQPVPAEWMTVLRDLEFRIPEGVVPQAAVAILEVPVERIPENVPAAPVANAVVDSSASATAPEIPKAKEPPVVVSIPTAESPPVEVKESPLAAVPADAQSVVPTATPGTVAEPAPVLPAVDFFHGRWLRQMRHQMAIPLQLLLHKLVTTEAELYALERQNIRLPLRWIPRLLKLGILSMEQSKAAARLNVSSQLNGAWLRQQRALLKLTPEELGRYLRASAVDVRVVESRMWPLPSEWFPILTALLEGRKRGKQKLSSAWSTSASQIGRAHV